MAKKEEAKIVLERTYNIPLRREWLKVPKYKRAKKAGKAVKEFLSKHMKSDEVKIGKYLNLKIWERGIKNPPHHIKVVCQKDDKGTVSAELFGAPKEKPKEEKKKVKETKEEKSDELKVEEVKEENAENKG